jgi:hypothetical protein
MSPLLGRLGVVGGKAATVAETFSGSDGLFMKARIHVWLLSSFSASSLW